MEQLRRTLEASGWEVEVRAAGRGVSGCASRPDGEPGPIRLSAYGRDRASVVLLLFEQACAWMLPDAPRRAG